MKRYVLTFINQAGQRQLMGANQGRNFHDSPEAAETRLKNVLEFTSEDTLIMIFGEQAIGTFEVRECDCYENGDAKGIYFD